MSLSAEALMRFRVKSGSCEDHRFQGPEICFYNKSDDGSRVSENAQIRNPWLSFIRSKAGAGLLKCQDQQRHGPRIHDLQLCPTGQKKTAGQMSGFAKQHSVPSLWYVWPRPKCTFRKCFRANSPTTANKGRCIPTPMQPTLSQRGQTPEKIQDAEKKIWGSNLLRGSAFVDVYLIVLRFVDIAAAQNTPPNRAPKIP